MQTRASPSLSTLHSLARQASIPGYLQLSKSVLYKKLKDQFNLDRLQRVESRDKQAKRTRVPDPDSDKTEAKRKRPRDTTEKLSTPPKKVFANTHDPIMLTPLGKYVFTFERPNGSVCRFNIDSLVDYLLATGDFHDPETRIPFTEDDLKSIDDLAIKSGLKKDSVLAAKRDSKRYSESIFRRDALLGLERCAGEVVSDMLKIVEDCYPDEAEMRLIVSEFPSFADLYHQIKDADPVFASQCMKRWTLFLRGPPNRPTYDEYGLLEVVLMFMKECDRYVPQQTSNSNSVTSSTSSS